MSSYLETLDEIICLSDNDSLDDMNLGSINIEDLLLQKDCEYDNDQENLYKFSNITKELTSQHYIESVYKAVITSPKAKFSKMDPKSLHDEFIDEISTLSDSLSDEPPLSGDLIDPLQSLLFAQKREQKLLKPDSIHIESPLTMKIKSLLTVNVFKTDIKYTEVDIISSQLRRNSHYKTQGPGIATTIYCNDKYIAIGTAHGIIFVINSLTQEIKHILILPQSQSSHSTSTSNTVENFISVCSIDMSATGDKLLSGYVNGNLCLWDIDKGIILKHIINIHKSNILRVKFLLSNHIPGIKISTNSDDLYAISVDSSGCVERLHFSRILWSSYGVDSECLLDATSGAVYDTVILPPPPPTTTSSLSPIEEQIPTSTSQKSSRRVPQDPVIMNGWEIAALNTASRTYIIQLMPSIRILCKWPSSTSTSTSSDTDENLHQQYLSLKLSDINTRTRSSTSTSTTMSSMDIPPHVPDSNTSTSTSTSSNTTSHISLDWCWLPRKNIKYPETSLSSSSSSVLPSSLPTLSLLSTSSQHMFPLLVRCMKRKIQVAVLLSNRDISSSSSSSSSHYLILLSTVNVLLLDHMLTPISQFDLQPSLQSTIQRLLLRTTYNANINTTTTPSTPTSTNTALNTFNTTPNAHPNRTTPTPGGKTFTTSASAGGKNTNATSTSTATSATSTSILCVPNFCSMHNGKLFVLLPDSLLYFYVNSWYKSNILDAAIWLLEQNDEINIALQLLLKEFDVELAIKQIITFHNTAVVNIEVEDEVDDVVEMSSDAKLESHSIWFTVLDHIYVQKMKYSEVAFADETQGQGLEDGRGGGGGGGTTLVL
eukprot:gene6151-12461_t